MICFQDLLVHLEPHHHKWLSPQTPSLSLDPSPHMDIHLWKPGDNLILLSFVTSMYISKSVKRWGHGQRCEFQLINLAARWWVTLVVLVSAVSKQMQLARPKTIHNLLLLTTFWPPTSAVLWMRFWCVEVVFFVHFKLCQLDSRLGGQVNCVGHCWHLESPPRIFRTTANVINHSRATEINYTLTKRTGTKK